MKTFIVSLLLICVVIAFTVTNTVYIVGRSNEMLEIAGALPKNKTDFEKDIPSAIEKAEQLWSIWDKTIDRFAYTIGYGHIDRADDAIAELYAAAKNGDGDSFVTAALKFRDALSRMKKLESFDFDSIM